MITLPPGARIWLAAGGSDMRRGFDGLARQVQQVLGHDPFGGHLFVVPRQAWKVRFILPPYGQSPGSRTELSY